ncbi:MAG: hypothetical protein QM757_31125 [Paludibaculum sp.]
MRQLANRFLLDFDEQIRNLEGSTPARESLVKTASEYLDSLASEAGNDAELRAELATAYRKLGDVQGGPRAASLGRSEDALKSYQEVRRDRTQPLRCRRPRARTSQTDHRSRTHARVAGAPPP